MSIYRKDGTATHPRPLTITEERIVQAMRSLAQEGFYFVGREYIRQRIVSEFPSTGNIFGSLEDLERDKIVAFDPAMDGYHLVGVIHA